MHNIDELEHTTKLLDVAPPTTLHHYTNATSIVSIINSRQFWAGLPEQMNDGEELHRAIRWLDTIAWSAELETNSPHTNQLFGEWVRRRIKAGDAVKGDGRSFVVSLSQSADSLSQWRAYTSGSGGVSLDLPGEMVREAAEKQGWYLAPCIYDEDDVKEMVTELFNWHLDRFAADYATFPDDDHKSFIAPMKRHTENLIDDIRLYGLFVKNPSFHAEEEWRLVTFDVEPGSDELAFSGGPTGIRAYLPFQILDDSPTAFPFQPRPSLTIGPTPLRGTTTYAAKRLLERWVGAGNADVYETISSYR